MRRGFEMGFRYRKSLRLGPVRINLGKRGIGTSIGIPGFRVTNSSNGRKYVTLGLPGTGLSWTKTLGASGRASRAVSSETSEQNSITPQIEQVEIESNSKERRQNAPLEFE
jgi:hypothetical protein